MENKVNVYFLDQLVGELYQDKYGTLSFQYDHDDIRHWFTNFKRYFEH
jgi:hypothetical protein